MMNRSSQPTSSSSDPYNFPSQIMPFASSLEEDNNSRQNPMNINFHPTAPNLFHHDTTNTLIPFYSSSSTSPCCMIKREDHQTLQLGHGVVNNIGLNLGHRTYFSSGDALTIDRLLTARAHHQHQHQHQHQPPRCQAEGCKADLSGAKHYHRRHKICEFHSKATVVIAGGMQQRFCQQCSRFHVLGEFDESKRSCRKRLADHNRRRRKSHNTTTNNNSSSTTTNSSDNKTKQCTTTTPGLQSYPPSKCTTASNSGMEVDQGDHQSNKGVLFRNGPALSLGGVEHGGGSHHNQHQGFYNYQHHSHFCPSTSNTDTTNNNNNNNNGSFYHHQSLFGSSSNMEASHRRTHDQNNLHLGQAMFEVDFM